MNRKTRSNNKIAVKIECLTCNVTIAWAYAELEKLLDHFVMEYAGMQEATVRSFPHSGHKIQWTVEK